MNRLLLFLMSVIFTSCSSYNYTSTPPQYYTQASFVEEPPQYPPISIYNWNAYSGYWNNYYYTPYYMTHYTSWSFNSTSNFTWNW